MLLCTPYLAFFGLAVAHAIQVSPSSTLVASINTLTERDGQIRVAQSLSDGLLAVIAAASTSSSTEKSLSKAKIESNSDKLNLFPQNSGTAATARASAACSACQILFGDNVITPQSSNYTVEQQEPWSQTCWLPAACFIKLQSPLEVALALKVLTTLQTVFAVRSRGHTPSAGFSSVGSSGVVVDLGALNQITLSSSKDVVSLGPGNSWDKVYAELEKSELTVVGGRSIDVGIGGLTLGGGMSHFTNHWGLACDNVKNFEVVLASSQIVNANASENADLYKTLKGGAANFGIVTRFDVYTHPDYKVWYTFRVYSIADKDAVMNATVEVQKSMELNDKIGLIMSVRNTSLTAVLLYRDWVNGHPSEFQPFYDLDPLIVALSETNGTETTVAQAAVMDAIAKRAIGTVSLKMDVQLYGDIQDILIKVHNTTDFNMAIDYQPVSYPAVDYGNSKGGNSMNIQPVNQIWLGIVADWTDDSLTAQAEAEVKQLIAEIKSTAEARGLLLDFDFLNDSSESQSPLRSYGADSLAYLNTVSQKYDPAGVFQKLQNDGFLLSKA